MFAAKERDNVDELHSKTDSYEFTCVSVNYILRSITSFFTLALGNYKFANQIRFIIIVCTVVLLIIQYWKRFKLYVPRYCYKTHISLCKFARHKSFKYLVLEVFFSLIHQPPSNKILCKFELLVPAVTIKLYQQAVRRNFELSFFLGPISLCRIYLLLRLLGHFTKWNSFDSRAIW